MAYRQYTQCVVPQSFSSHPIGNAVAAALFMTLLGIVSVILATGGLAGLAGGAAVALGVVTGLLSFVHWWLYGRLICLGGDRCAIGMVLSVEPPSGKTLTFPRLDSDYSFNLLLPPLLPGASAAEVIAKGVNGELINEQTATSQYSLDFKGVLARSCDADACGKDKCPETAALHCEFEGAGMYIFYQWLKVIFALLVVATVAAVFCVIPIIGWIACLIAAALLVIALLAFIASVVHGNLDAGSPSDIDPSLGSEMHQNGCDGTGADLVVVSGEWVYDSLHEGWNEIHPIRHCQRIGRWNGTWPFGDPMAERDKWCGAIASAGSPLTISNQGEPQHQWTVHPTVDGCKPEGNHDDAGPIIK